MSAQYPRCYITRSVLTDGSLVHDVTICMDSVSTTTIFCCNAQSLIDALTLNNVEYIGTYQTIDGILQFDKMDEFCDALEVEANEVTA